MKLIALALTFCLSFNVLAASGTIHELERQLDEYQYALTVEWDQEDGKFYSEQTQIFFKNLSILMVEKGLSKDEVVSLIESKITDKTALEALKLKLSLMGEVNSSEELIKVLQDNASSFYTRGASWNGRSIETFALGFLVVAVIGYTIWFGANHTCVAWDEEWKCKSETYVDSYGSTYTDTVCGWEEYCTRYEKN